jgi:predicted DNA-binding protein
MGRMIVTTVYLTEEQDRALKDLGTKTRVPVAQYVREGVDLVLEKYEVESYGQLSFETILKKKKEQKPKDPDQQ